MGAPMLLNGGLIRWYPRRRASGTPPPIADTETGRLTILADPWSWENMTGYGPVSGQTATIPLTAQSTRT